MTPLLAKLMIALNAFSFVILSIPNPLLLGFWWYHEVTLLIGVGIGWGLCTFTRTALNDENFKYWFRREGDEGIPREDVR